MNRKNPIEPRNALANAVELMRRKGARAYRVGNEIEVTHQLGKLRFVVIGVSRDLDIDYSHTLTLLMRPIVLGSPFSKLRLGERVIRNSYHQSIIREMLNAEFLDGFTAADRQVMVPAQRRTYSFTEREYIYTRDRIFLLSASEAGFAIDGKTVADEGSAYPFFAAFPCARALCDTSGHRRYWWLRSPSPDDYSGARIVTPDGLLSSGSAQTIYAVAAACVIGCAHPVNAQSKDRY